MTSLEFVKEVDYFGIVNVAAEESVLNEKVKIDVAKTGMLLYDSFSSSYFTLGERVGKAFGEGSYYTRKR